MPKKPNTMKDKRFKMRVFTNVCRELGKEPTLMLLEILGDNPDGLTWKEITIEFLKRNSIPGSYRRIVRTMRKFRLCGFISKRRRYVINIHMATTKKMGKDQRNMIYYLEQPGRDFLYALEKIVKAMQSGLDNKKTGKFDNFPGASEPIDDLEEEI